MDYLFFNAEIREEKVNTFISWALGSGPIDFSLVA